MVPEPDEFDSQSTPLDLEDKGGFFPFKKITDVWINLSPPDSWLEEIDVETQVLDDNEKINLNMIDAQKQMLQQNIDGYRKLIDQHN